MEIKPTRFSREDGVHITESPDGWIVLCQNGPMWVWTGEKWEVIFQFEPEDFAQFCHTQDEAMEILKTVPHVKGFQEN